MPTTYIIGHQKPDTDAVVAPMALAHLYQHQACFEYHDPKAVITHELNPETSYLFKKLGLEAPALIKAEDIKDDEQVVLADHNEESQRLTGLDPDKIVDIIDHHKINLDLNNPIYLTFKPWGSTTTIVYHLMKRHQVEPDQKLATLMLAAILSDTVGYKSATTTDRDREYGQELAQLAQVDDVVAFTLELFKAKSNLGDLSDEEIVKNDYKVYEFGSQKVMISQLETVEQADLIAQRKESLLEAMAKVKEAEGLDLFIVVITDVLQVNSKILVLSKDEQTVLEKAFGGQVSDQVLDIGPKMSRKKEIAPPVEAAIK